MKKLQSCAGKADMFVERSRNKYLYVIFRIEREWNAEYEETEATGGN